MQPRQEVLHELVACSITARFDQAAARQFEAQQGFDLQENLDRLCGGDLGLNVKDGAPLFAGIGGALPQRRFCFAFPPGAQPFFDLCTRKERMGGAQSNLLIVRLPIKIADGCSIVKQQEPSMLFFRTAR